ncbi:ComF family protein [Ascidiimonas sp. W6]|uniref:ComF family protein n=1 Tax=Ascidiimonas meishanensis TaxID=3128903 RepID=UPI0030EEF777
MSFNAVNILNDIENLFFPEVCLACMEKLVANEKTICIACRHNLPLTHFHNYKGNPVEQILYGRFKLENATAFLYYREAGSVRNLIHNLKYKHQEQIGDMLGVWMGYELSKIENYKKIDAVIPVPLHHKRLKKRGYNQVAQFGKQLAVALDANYIDNVLYRTVNSRTQTLKNRLKRWEHIETIFAIKNQHILKNKHLLIVDDIITTGATIEACANSLKVIQGIKLSIATMAITE